MNNLLISIFRFALDIAGCRTEAPNEVIPVGSTNDTVLSTCWVHPCLILNKRIEFEFFNEKKKQKELVKI